MAKEIDNWKLYLLISSILLQDCDDNCLWLLYIFNKIALLYDYIDELNQAVEKKTNPKNKSLLFTICHSFILNLWLAKNWNIFSGLSHSHPTKQMIKYRCWINKSHPASVPPALLLTRPSIGSTLCEVMSPLLGGSLFTDRSALRFSKAHWV